MSDVDPCEACARGMAADCPQSKRTCGHHCECSWVQDVCHWCGVEFGDDSVPAVPTESDRDD